LTAGMLVLGGVADSPESAKAKINEILDSGAAFEKFRENVEVQGGDVSVCDEPQILVARDLENVPVLSTSAGFIGGIDTAAIGNAICSIGGGRSRAEDVVDHAVGFASLVRIGQEIAVGETLGVIYCRNAGQSDSVGQNLLKAYEISDDPVAQPALVKTIVT